MINEGSMERLKRADVSRCTRERCYGDVAELTTPVTYVSLTLYCILIEVIIARVTNPPYLHFCDNAIDLEK